LRAGLRVRGERGNAVVRRAIIRYAVWLRQEFEFPVRVPVYLLPGKTVRTIHGNHVSASFFAPWDRSVEPYIRIATGDYADERRRRGRDDALASFLTSLSHEIVHYRQWIETGRIWESRVASEAVAITRRYAETTDRP
jgi:hypothetical protein